MPNDVNDGFTGEMFAGFGGPLEELTPLMPPAEADSQELWRVVSADGSTRIFQTKPTLDPRAGKRQANRRVSPCPLEGDDGLPVTTLFENGSTTRAPLVTESVPPSAADTELSAELTSVTQAWPTLSPGIRGAVMALIRAASTAKSPRPTAGPRRE